MVFTELFGNGYGDVRSVMTDWHGLEKRDMNGFDDGDVHYGRLFLSLSACLC